MAKDYFARPAMSPPAESLFSCVNDVVTKKRNRMLPEMVKMLAFVKYIETLSGSKGIPSSFDGGGESDEMDEEIDEELDEELDAKVDGDLCDAARTSEGKEAAAVNLSVS